MFAILSVLLLASVRATFASHENDFCAPVTDQAWCSWTFGCAWSGGALTGECDEQDDWFEGPGTGYGCDGYRAAYGEPPTYYECYDDPDGTFYYVYLSAQFDSCSYDQYHNDLSSCPATSSTGAVCQTIANRCYELDPCDANPYATGCPCDVDALASGCYPYKTNSGICYSLSTVGGCGAVPFCNWNNSNCQPDWKCYYSHLNEILPAYSASATGYCNTSSTSDGGNGCRYKNIDGTTYCTSDTITTDDEACIKAGASQSTCEGAGCEWIPPVTTGNNQYVGWCVQVGSGTSIVRMSSVALMVILSVMLTFL